MDEVTVSGVPLRKFTLSGLVDLQEDRRAKLDKSLADVVTIKNELRQISDEIRTKQTDIFDAPDAEITYIDVQVYFGMRRMDGVRHKTYPKRTKQGFDYRQNLFAHMGD